MHHEFISHSLAEEFASGWSCDNAMTALSIRAGQAIDPAQLIELCSGAKTVFSLVTLVCREMYYTEDCRQLWRDALETFERAQTAWADVPSDNEPMLRFYLGQLSRLLDLSRDRVDIYTISRSERLAFVRRYKGEPALDRREPNGDSSAEEKRIARFVNLPI